MVLSSSRYLLIYFVLEWSKILTSLVTRVCIKSWFKSCLRPGSFLLWLSDCILETYMLLALVRVHEHWENLDKSPLGGSWVNFFILLLFRAV